MVISASVSGSFNKFLKQIFQKIKEIEDNNIEVLSPKISDKKYEKSGFIMLEGDKGKPKEIELKHLNAISLSDFLYVVNPGGYMGTSVCLEIGLAFSKGIPIFCQESPQDKVFSSFVRSNLTISEIKKIVEKSESKLRHATLGELQMYIKKVVQERGFQEEALQEVLLLFVEEVGELAKAIRTEIGLKVSKNKDSSYKTIGEELADCLIYLLDMANLSNVDLERALRYKESINARKEWIVKRKAELNQS